MTSRMLCSSPRCWRPLVWLRKTPTSRNWTNASSSDKDKRSTSRPFTRSSTSGLAATTLAHQRTSMLSRVPRPRVRVREILCSDRFVGVGGSSSQAPLRAAPHRGSGTTEHRRYRTADGDGRQYRRQSRPDRCQTVEIVLNRWSTDGERDRLLIVLQDQGPAKLLDALHAVPRIGYIRTPDSLGYELHFARKTPGEDGGEDIVIATDRYIGFWRSGQSPAHDRLPVHRHPNAHEPGWARRGTAVVGHQDHRRQEEANDHSGKLRHPTRAADQCSTSTAITVERTDTHKSDRVVSCGLDIFARLLSLLPWKPLDEVRHPTYVRSTG